MVLSWFRASSTPQSSESDSKSIPSSTPQTQTPTQTQTQTQETPPSPSTTPTTTTPQETSDDLPKLWTPQTNKKLFFGGALFFVFSLLTTRRALIRRHRASIPPYYTSSTYHKPEVNGGFEAFEALHLATINVLSFGMMSSGGVLWAMGINGLDDMRSYVRKRMAEGAKPLTETDQEMEREVEAWVGKYLGKRIEGEKLVDLNEPTEEKKST